MVAINGIGQKAADGWHVSIEPLGAVGSVGMTGALFAQIGLEGRMGFTGVVYIPDEVGDGLGGEGLGEFHTFVAHAFGMGFQSLPLRVILVVWQGMRETLIPIGHPTGSFSCRFSTGHPTCLYKTAQHRSILARCLSICKRSFSQQFPARFTSLRFLISHRQYCIGLTSVVGYAIVRVEGPGAPLKESSVSLVAASNGSFSTLPLSTKRVTLTRYNVTCM